MSNNPGRERRRMFMENYGVRSIAELRHQAAVAVVERAKAVEKPKHDQEDTQK
jgi:hypothetical protein